MMTTSAARGVGFTREPEDEAETRLYVKPAMPWDRVMVLQIMKDLEGGGARRLHTPAPRAAAARPNVFLTPLPSDPPAPWAKPRKSPARSKMVVRKAPPRQAKRQVPPEDETQLRPRWRHQAPRRMMLPWALFLMYFLIAFGVGQDRVLRGEVVSKLRYATAQTAVVAQSSAIWLWTRVSRIRT